MNFDYQFLLNVYRSMIDDQAIYVVIEDPARGRVEERAHDVPSNKILADAASPVDAHQLVVEQRLEDVALGRPRTDLLCAWVTQPKHLAGELHLAAFVLREPRAIELLSIAVQVVPSRRSGSQGGPQAPRDQVFVGLLHVPLPVPPG